MTALLLPVNPPATALPEVRGDMVADRFAKIRRAWRGSSSRFFSPALWMSDEELEIVAARVKGCSVATIHRAVEIAEAASALLECSNVEVNGGNHGTAQTQAASPQDQDSKISSHTLKIEEIGDFAYRKVIPRIRLRGQWLEKAGFKPGHRVEIRLLKPGEMVLQFKEQLPPLTSDNNGKR